MIDELIKANLISKKDAETYYIFAASELGRNWLAREIDEAFMEQIPMEMMTADKIVFVDGRRSWLRQIRFTIDHVQSQLRKQLDDSRSE